MNPLRKYLDKIKPDFEKGGKFEKLHPSRKQGLAFIALLLITGMECAFAGKIDIINKTDLDFHSIIIDYERNEGRQIREYTGGVFGTSHYNPDAANKTDTVPYQKKVDLKKGICKLTFVAKDSLCMVYAVDTEKTEKLVLNRASAAIEYDMPPRLHISAGVQLFFNFVNESCHTVYGIYPEFSNRSMSHGPILFNTDERLLPNEQRSIFIEQAGQEAEYYMSISIEFTVYAVDSNGRLRKARIRETDLSTENILISNSDFL
jgi:hypothetical protein